MYQLLLTLNGKSVILEAHRSKESVESMLNWYVAHKEFFNGEFSIEYAKVV